MDMSVSATGSSALRKYQKSAGVGDGTTSPDTAQQTFPAGIDGTNMSSPPGRSRLSDNAHPALSPSSGYEDVDIKELNANLSAMGKHLLAMQEYGTALSEYGKAMSKRAEESQQMMQGFFSKMQRELGGAQTAMAIPNDPLGPEPVRTSSGRIHPQSDRIKDYIRAHKDEWDSLSFQEASFEEWQRARS